MNSMQRKLAGLGVSVVVAGAFAAYGYFGTYKGKKAEEEKKEKEEKVVSFTAGDVKEIRLTAKGQSFELIGDGQGENKWRITKPVTTPAEKATVDGLVSHFVDMKRKIAIDLKSENLQNFGLMPPQATVAFKIGDKDVIYLIGKKNSFDDHVYLMQEGTNKVLMVPGGITYQTDRDLFAWREKRLATFEDRDVKKIDVELKGAAAYSIEKKGDEWWLPEIKADKAQVTSLLSGLRYTRAKSFAAETLDPKEAEKYGLAKPELVVTVQLGDAKAVYRFGTTKGVGGTEQYFAMVDGQPAVFELSESVLKKWDLKTSDLRDKQVMAFDREAIKKVKLAETGKDFVLIEKKKKDDGGETWEVIAPEQKPAMDSKLANLLYKLSNLKAKAIVAEKPTPEIKKQHGLDPVGKQITLYKADGSEAATIVLGNTTGEDVSVFVQGGTRIDSVDKSQLSDVSFDAKDYFKEQAPLSKQP